MCGEGTPGLYDVGEFGALGDGVRLNTRPIQAAIDAAAKAGGGIVIVSAGTYLTGTIALKSRVHLQLHPAARLLGSPRQEDYAAKTWGQHIDRTPWHLLVADGCQDITVSGGTIDGNGPAFWEPCVAGSTTPANAMIPPGAFGGLHALSAVTARVKDPAKAPISWIKAQYEQRPSPMIEITGCRNVRILDTHITNSAGWNLHLHNSDLIWIRGVTLTANLMGPNNDGFDITGCRDVFIADCHLSCCDDAICLKTTPDSRSCERIVVTNCVIRTQCVALKFGCAESFFDFRQVTFTNCVVHQSSRAVGIYTKEGGIVEDVTISNIICDTRNPFMANRPIQIDCMRQRPESRLGAIRNVVISNLIARTDGRILLTADPASPLEDIVLRDIQLIYPTIDDPDPICRDLPCGQFSPQHPDARCARAAVVAKNAVNLAIDNLMVRWPETDAQGRIRCPEEWRFPIKAVNGGFDVYYDRAQFNREVIPDFHVLWGRNLRGGYLRAPLAKPPRAGIATCDLAGSDFVVQ